MPVPNSLPDPDELPSGFLEPVQRLKKDVLQAAADLGKGEVRHLVDAYYEMQDRRKRSDQQTNALEASGEPNSVIAWLADQDGLLEAQVKRALDYYSAHQPLGQWMRSQVGVGPVIAAGLLAHIPWETVTTFGKIQRFAGLDPTQEWLGREKATELVGTKLPQYVTEAMVRDLAPIVNETPSAFMANATALAELSGAPLDLYPSGALRRTDIRDYLIAEHGYETLVAADEEIALRIPAGGPQPRRPYVYASELFDIAGEIHQATDHIIAGARKFAEMKGADLGDLPDDAVKRSDLIAHLSRRPWNAALKTLCWKIGDSFVKFSNHPKSFYGPVYRRRKELEERRNADGLFADQAEETLRKKRISDPATRAIYESGRLPAGRLDLRARRVAVKLFLSHAFEVGYQIHHGTNAPIPYPIAHMGHVDYIPPPNWPMTEGDAESEP